MKRKRKFPTTATKTGDTDEQIQHIDPFITNIPKPVIQDVLLRLPTKSIIICKCVCKTWHDLLSEPEFAKLHFSQAEAYPLVWPFHPNRVSRTLYLLEPQDISVFDLKDCECNNRKLKCIQCHVHINLGKYKVPLRNAEKVIDIDLVHSRNQGTARKKCINILSNEHKYKVVNSCNGFLCLSEPIFGDPVVVCNPITGEFILLPEASGHTNSEEVFVVCGIGFSLKTNQYKVIRISEVGTPRPSRVAEVHTVGTGSWECIGSIPFSSASFSRFKAEFTSYMAGVIYWFYRELSLSCIDSFDIDNGRFQSAPPLPFELRTTNHHVSMGVLGDSLSLCEVAFLDDINVWVMFDDGGEKSWVKEFCISTLSHERQWPFGLYQPMKILKNGGLLMFHSASNAFMYYHPKDHAYKYLKLCGSESNCEAISHVPTFNSLKSVLSGTKTEVLNINSRCAGYKLRGEVRALSLEEEEIQICFPKEVYDEITSVVVSTGNRMQC